MHERASDLASLEKETTFLPMRIPGDDIGKLFAQCLPNNLYWFLKSGDMDGRRVGSQCV